MKRNKPVYIAEDKPMNLYASLIKFIQSLQNELNDVPEEFKNKVRIRLIPSDYEVLVDIYYIREETDEEEQQRLNQAETIKANEREEELALLAKLKEKYE